MNNKLEGITWHAQGEANFYRLMRGNDWVAIVQFNGELLVWDQEQLLNAMLQGQQAAPVGEREAFEAWCEESGQYVKSPVVFEAFQAGAAYQRQSGVVGRVDESKYSGALLDAARRLNACLDEFARLNAGKEVAAMSKPNETGLEARYRIQVVREALASSDRDARLANMDAVTLLNEATKQVAALEAELAKQRAVLDGFVLVPVEPTPEMVSAAEEAHMPFGDMDIALRMAILSAPSTPATVQGVNAQLLEALEAILPFIPNTSAAEGGAARYSENVRAADKVRAAIDAARKGEGE